MSMNERAMDILFIMFRLLLCSLKSTLIKQAYDMPTQPHLKTLLHSLTFIYESNGALHNNLDISILSIIQYLPVHSLHSQILVVALADVNKVDLVKDQLLLFLFIVYTSAQVSELQLLQLFFCVYVFLFSCLGLMGRQSFFGHSCFGV